MAMDPLVAPLPPVSRAESSEHDEHSKWGPKPLRTAHSRGSSRLSPLTSRSQVLMNSGAETVFGH